MLGKMAKVNKKKRSSKKATATRFVNGQNYHRADQPGTAYDTASRLRGLRDTFLQYFARFQQSILAMVSRASSWRWSQEPQG